MRWLVLLAALVLWTPAAVAQDDEPPARLVLGLLFDYGFVGADRCLSASDSCRSGQLTLGSGLDLRWLQPSGPGAVVRVRYVGSPGGGLVTLVPFEIGYAHRLPPGAVGGGSFFDASLTATVVSVIGGGDLDAPDDHWAIGLGATLAYAFRIGAAGGAIGPYGHWLPVVTGRDGVYYAGGLELRLGVDFPLAPTASRSPH